MDLNDLRAAITVLSFAIFIGICVWAWSARRKPDFEKMARLPLDEDASDAVSEGKRDE